MGGKSVPCAWHGAVWASAEEENIALILPSRSVSAVRECQVMNTGVTLKEKRVKHVQQYQRWSAVQKSHYALAWVSDTDNHRYHSGFTAIIYIWILAMCQKTTWKQWDKVKGVAHRVFIGIYSEFSSLLDCQAHYFIVFSCSFPQVNTTLTLCTAPSAQTNWQTEAARRWQTMESSGVTVKSQVLPSGVGRDRKQR